MPKKITLKHWKLYQAEESDRTVKVIALNKGEAADLIGRERKDLTEIKGPEARKDIRRAFGVDKKK